MADPWCILDDFFPNVLTAFRVAEYNAYLAASPGLTIFSSHPRFKAFHEQYADRYPEHAHRVRPLDRQSVAGNRFAYLNFLNNAHTFLPLLEAGQTPFVFTLYPGGGFGLNEPESDAKLMRVTGSPLLQGVITTQPVSERYLAEKVAHVPRRYVYGGVLHPIYFTPEHDAMVGRRLRFGAGKPTLDICFVAEKYMPGGVNKGYPLFVEAAQAVAARVPAARIHVVGGFGPEDAAFDLPPERLLFHGRQETAALRNLMLHMDVVVSPNVPFELHAGNFDGFPTASCAEAALCGAAMVVTDVLGLNRTFRAGEEIVIVPPDSEVIAERLVELAAAPDRLAALADAGREVTRRTLSPDLQVGQRRRVLSEMASKVGVDLGFST